VRLDAGRVPVYQPLIGEDELANVIAAARSGWISSLGGFVPSVSAGSPRSAEPATRSPSPAAPPPCISRSLPSGWEPIDVLRVYTKNVGVHQFVPSFSTQDTRLAQEVEHSFHIRELCGDLQGREEEKAVERRGPSLRPCQQSLQDRAPSGVPC